MLIIFVHWAWLKYAASVTVAESIALSTISLDQIWSYISVSLAVLTLSTLGSSLLISRKKL